MNTKKLLLCVNIDHVATLRQARLGQEPSVIQAAQIAEKAGADGITVHLREDRRHIQDFDLPLLKQVVKGRLTLEMAASEQMLQIAKTINPNLLTIVPERRQELTTEGGLDVIGQAKELEDFLYKVAEASLEASLFIDPDKKVIDKAKQVGAKRIELHTGKYANCKVGSPEAQHELMQLKAAAEYAHNLGFIVNAGHGLNLQNLPAVLKVPHLQELHIGHSIVGRAVLVGMAQAVKEVKELLK
jgi:pyridoxine 5-phosphate synthase